jgi:hypothetical protein
MDNTIPRGHRQEGLRVGLLGWGSASPEPDEDGPTIMVVATPVAGKNGGTCKISSVLA